jgi:hypothetical protein
MESFFPVPGIGNIVFAPLSFDHPVSHLSLAPFSLFFRVSFEATSHSMYVSVCECQAVK